MNKFWNWNRNEDTGQRELYLEGVIAQESWYGDEVTPAAFKADLTEGQGPITLHINSCGGDCIAASMIYTMLMEYPFDVTVQIDGLAASAASVIAMAGTRVCMSPTGLFLLHNPWTSAVGDTADMQKAIALLDEVKESILNAYEIKTGLDRQTLSQLMDQETWMSAYRAKELGFCDDVLFDGDEPAEKVRFDFSDRAAALRVLNLAGAVIQTEKCSEPVEEKTVSAEQPADTFPSKEQASSAPYTEETPKTESPDRVSVRITDDRLENLRY